MVLFSKHWKVILYQVPKLFSVFLGFFLCAASAGVAAAETIAILPLQNQGDPLYTLCEHTSDLQKLSDFFGKGVGKKPPDRDQRNKNLIERVLVAHIRTVLEQKGHKVLSGEDYAELYRRLEARGEPVSYKELQKLVQADSFLLVTIGKWEGGEFESAGKLEVAYQVHWIRPGQKENNGIAWSRKSEETVQLEPSEFLFRKRQEEVLEELSRMFLKGFPKAIALKDKK